MLGRKISQNTFQGFKAEAKMVMLASLDDFTHYAVNMDKLKKVANNGLGNFATYRGVVKGISGQVFIKLPKRNELNQARWSLILNRIGIGPTIYGKTIINGRLGLIYENIVGPHFPNSSGTLPKGFKVKGNHLIMIQKTGAVLHQFGIKYTPDMQFILSKKGRAVLVDPEYFSFRVPRNKSVDLPFDPVTNSADIVEDLQRVSGR